MAATLKIEADGERAVLLGIVAKFTHDYPIDAELELIETEIVRLNLCARILRAVDVGCVPVDDVLLAELRTEAGELVDAIGDEDFSLAKLAAPDASEDDWTLPLADAKLATEETRRRYVQELESCRRLIARAEAVA